MSLVDNVVPPASSSLWINQTTDSLCLKPRRPQAPWKQAKGKNKERWERGGVGGQMQCGFLWLN